MFRSAQKGFTLIEVLIVIGIIGILATVALVAINPAEAQKKGRDAQRLKDVVTLQTAVEQYIADNTGYIVSTTTVSSNSGSNPKSCSAGWIGFNVCQYLNTLPVDPINGIGAYTNSVGSTDNPPTTLKYTLKGNGSGKYKLCTYFESAANKNRIGSANDGGIDDVRYEIGSDMTIACE